MLSVMDVLKRITVFYYLERQGRKWNGDINNMIKNLFPFTQTILITNNSPKNQAKEQDVVASACCQELKGQKQRQEDGKVRAGLVQPDRDRVILSQKSKFSQRILIPVRDENAVSNQIRANYIVKHKAGQ